MSFIWRISRKRNELVSLFFFLVTISSSKRIQVLKLQLRTAIWGINNRSFLILLRIGTFDLP